MSHGVIKGGITLALIAAICTTLVAATYQLTAERIAANEQAWLERSLEPALSGVFFEGSVSESKLVIPPPHELPGNDAAIVYRVFAEGEPVAALFAVTARDGYTGPIRILVGIGVDGIVTGVRIVEHRETPGLGDRIDQTRSDWVYQFDDRALGNPVEARWLLAVDGGEFDQLTGASITPRAVVKAIRETLIYFAAHRDEIFTLPATEDKQ
ncbi:MAG: electron transport complex subunit RsxG [Woeseiaceae bacterium]|nr:electron transport complex subunit RsxG [Woeseiaceae bacterium]